MQIPDMLIGQHCVLPRASGLVVGECRLCRHRPSRAGQGRAGQAGLGHLGSDGDGRFDRRKACRSWRSPRGGDMFILQDCQVLPAPVPPHPLFLPAPPPRVAFETPTTSLHISPPSQSLSGSLPLSSASLAFSTLSLLHNAPEA